MKKVLVALAPGFEEIETITVVDILRRAGARVVLAATVEGPRRLARGICLQNNKRVKAIIQNMHRSRKQVTAICAAPTILHSVGILKDTTATSYPSVKDQLKVFIIPKSESWLTAIL